MKESDYPWITRVHALGTDNPDIIPNYNTYIGYPSSGILVIGHCNSGNHWIRDIFRRLKIEFASSHVGSGNGSTYTFYQIQKKILETPNILNLQTSKVIFIYRDPRDVMVSSFCSRGTQRKNLEIEILTILSNSNKLDKFKKLETWASARPLGFYTISEMIQDMRAGIEKCIQFNLFMQGYLNNAHFVKYEDLKADTFTEIKNIVNFLKLKIPNEKIIEAIEYCSFENMKSREIKKRINSGEEQDPEKLKYRKGVTGGYINYMTAEDIKYCNALLKKYNYYA